MADGCLPFGDIFFKVYVENKEDYLNFRNPYVIGGRVSCSNYPPDVFTLTSFTGPSGPAPKILPATGGLFSHNSVAYEGVLDKGNHFGTCDVVVMGAYEEAPSITGILGRYKGTWTAKGTIEITPPNVPVFIPAQLVIPKGGQGTVQVSITPACKYSVTLRHGDEMPGWLQVLPTLLQTAPDGTGTITVRDLRNAARGPVPVVATLAPESPCVGSPVTGTFTVLITE